MSENRILKTEMRNPDSKNIDRMTTAGMLDIIQRENENAVRSIRAAHTSGEALTPLCSKCFATQPTRREPEIESNFTGVRYFESAVSTADGLFALPSSISPAGTEMITTL